MSGTVTVYQLLAADAGIRALLPVSGVSPPQLAAGTLAQNVALPWIAINRISSSDRETVSPGSDRLVTERVQVTFAARNYDAIEALDRAIKLACADKRPVVAGISDVKVHTAPGGADALSASGQFTLRTRDFLVRYLEATAS